jgi:alkanesulfonate monooxygenase SsuD/methylene tetrahydromethanopterin reductase-like flavin-dependent oxidoreductase (luciferase family)
VRFLLENDDAVAAARAARDAGLDGVLLAELPAPLITAAALAGQVDDALVAAEVPLGDRHPLELAEEAIVTDLALGGRLILVVGPAPGHEERFDEAFHLLHLCLTPRPFRFEGRYWKVPANLPQNAWLPEEEVVVTPSPPRARLEVWPTSALAREGWTDSRSLVERLRRTRPEWVAVAAPVEAARELGSIVRPRVQMHRLSPGLEEFWDAERPWER